MSNAVKRHYTPGELQMRRATLEDLPAAHALYAAARAFMVQAGNPTQWGAGKFNAYAGLKEAIRRAGVTDVTIDSQSPLMIATADHRSFELFVGNARSVEARVYNVAGQQVAFDRASGDQLNLNLSHLAAGVYVVNVNGNLSRRIIVK